MNKVKATGTMLALGAAAMFAIAPVYASSSDASSTTINCKGINACKGQGGCKTATNTCKGQNSCKGQGVTSTTKEQCEKAGGTVEAANASSNDSSTTQQ